VFTKHGGKMNCFVHLGFDPVPKERKSAASAIVLAESALKSEKVQQYSGNWQIQWRRDEFYPDNLHNYTSEQLEEELKNTGSVVLQLVNNQDELPSLGSLVTIFTAEIETKYVKQAETALENTDEFMDKKKIDSHGESQLKRRTRIKKK
jgi:hypothetical protein